MHITEGPTSALPGDSGESDMQLRKVEWRSANQSSAEVSTTTPRFSDSLGRLPGLSTEWYWRLRFFAAKGCKAKLAKDTWGQIERKPNQVTRVLSRWRGLPVESHRARRTSPSTSWDNRVRARGQGVGSGGEGVASMREAQERLSADGFHWGLAM